MSTFGLIGLLVAFAAVAVSVVCLIVGHVLGRGQETPDSDSLAATLSWAGRIAAVLSFAALTFCCGILVYAFMVGDPTMQYVLENQSNADGILGVLYRFSGLWAGRQGSLLFWAWLISLFNLIVALRGLSRLEKLDNMALMIAQLVLLAFVGVLLFSESNMPFMVTDESYYANGELTVMGTLLGMNTLLEHWAMAIHPPTLFIGYAGFTIPFAYAVAALIVNDPSKLWVERCERFAIFSWLFLGIGIGLGSVWAYVVLGWGGYWGWDPVENASLLSWLMGVALIHSFTMYRQRGSFKAWGVMCACLTFAFVIVGTFITRSGLVQSVHAFAGDPVSLTLFLGLIIASVLAGVIGLAIRRKTFGASEDDDFESMGSRMGMYYVNNVLMVAMTLLICYMTISSALPSFLPFGGEALSAGTYNAIARPLGIVYLAIMAVCPLLGWSKTDPKAFFKRMRLPAIAAACLFVVFAAFWAFELLPAYDAAIAAGGSRASAYADYGPAAYYNGLALLGFLVSSLLLFNSLSMLKRGLQAARKNAALIGGAISHTGMAIILAGLIGSSMYVTQVTGYLEYDEESDSCPERFQVADYELEYTGSDIYATSGGADLVYEVQFDVYRDGENIGSLAPSVQLVQATMQQKLNAAVLSSPIEDLFVVYSGVNENGAFALDVRVNPLISFVWVGFGVLMLGMLVALAGRRAQGRAAVDAPASIPGEAELPAAEDEQVK